MRIRVGHIYEEIIKLLSEFVIFCILSVITICHFLFNKNGNLCVITHYKLQG